MESTEEKIAFAVEEERRKVEILNAEEE